jgi:hypothetical protein
MLRGDVGTKEIEGESNFKVRKKFISEDIRVTTNSFCKNVLKISTAWPGVLIAS